MGLLTAVAAVFGHDLVEHLSLGGTTAPDAESVRADHYLGNAFGAGTPQLVLIARAPTPVDEPAAVAAGRSLTQRVHRSDGVQSVTSYWSSPDPRLRSRDGRAALVLVRFNGSEQQADSAAKRLIGEMAGQQGALRITATGETAVRNDIQRLSNRDLTRGELLALPLTLLILLVVFRSAVAAALPLAVGAFAVLCTMAVLKVLTSVTTVSIYAVNITTALGFALAVDYSLFVVTRFREELTRGETPAAAIDRTMRTTGRAVVFSAVTVAASLSALLVFDIPMLRSIAYGGVIVSTFAAIGSTLILPVLLTAAGSKINAADVRRLWRRDVSHRPADGDGRSWDRLARSVMQRPLLVAIPVVAVLLSLLVPFFHVRFGLFDDRILPPSSAAGQAAATLRHDLDAKQSVTALRVAVPGIDATGEADRIAAYARELSSLNGVQRVDAVTGTYRHGHQIAPAGPSAARFVSPYGTWLSVVSNAEPYSPASGELAREVRRLDAPRPALVAGPGAGLADVQRAIGERLLWSLALVGAAMFALVVAFTGKPFLALKALLLNTLSLTATFGAIVFVFQDGHLRWLVGDFAVTHTTDTLLPALLFCVAFGISMDYEMFLLSRIVEEHQRTGDTIDAVAAGLQHTGRLFTSAAVVFAVVMFVLATSDIVLLKIIGIGLALAVLLDATLIRSLVVPATMRLAGHANWWSPWRSARKTPPLVVHRPSGEQPVVAHPERGE